jgi:hypothetical protein
LEGNGLDVTLALPQVFSWRYREKNTETLSQDRRGFGRDSNRAHPGLKSRALLLDVVSWCVQKKEKIIEFMDKGRTLLLTKYINLS